jgi:hypothetical protein
MREHCVVKFADLRDAFGCGRLRHTRASSLLGFVNAIDVGAFTREWLDARHAGDDTLAGVMAKNDPQATGAAASRLIDQRIVDLGDWRGETLAHMRKLILEADPEMTEEWKWGGPVWSHHGIVCTGETYKQVVKLTFAKGAKIDDPSGVFNSSLEGATRRAIDIREKEKVDARAFKALVKAAVALNTSTATAKQPRPRSRG